MARSDRVALSSIKTLTLYADQPTKARRTAPGPQLECSGKVCRDYQPSAIQCTNIGGTDIDIDWKCEADLPSSLRFGRLQVSCEGWDRPGDPFVLRGSCGLTYSLVRTPQYAQPTSSPSYTYLFGIALVLLAIFLYINRHFLRFLNPFASTPSDGRGGGPTSSNSNVRSGYGTGGSGSAPPPPPYTKHWSPNQSDPPSNQRWTPGFWSGLGAGGLAASTYHYLTSRDRFYNPTYYTPGPRTEWDWERPVFTRTSGAAQPEYSAAHRRTFGFDNDGAGSSTGPGTQLGEMRRATGFGGSSVR